MIRNLIIRTAHQADAKALGRMSAKMMGFHYEFDKLRFILPENPARGYAWWLTEEMKNPRAVVMVAELEEREGPRIVGYTYGTIEETNWRLLVGPHAELHDVWVDPEARGLGVGRQLTEATFARFKELNAPRVLLMTAAQNEPAQKLFASLGFRSTMLEMTKEL